MLRTIICLKVDFLNIEMMSMLSERLKPLKVLDDYKYRQDKKVKEGQRWRCTRRSCSVSIITDLEGNNLIKGPERHHLHFGR